MLLKETQRLNLPKLLMDGLFAYSSYKLFLEVLCHTAVREPGSPLHWLLTSPCGHGSASGPGCIRLRSAPPTDTWNEMQHLSMLCSQLCQITFLGEWSERHSDPEWHNPSSLSDQVIKKGHGLILFAHMNNHYLSHH